MDIEKEIHELKDMLGTLIKIQALSAVSGLNTSKEKILFLHDAGLAPKNIGSIVGTKSGTVRQVIYADGKAKKKEE